MASILKAANRQSQQIATGLRVTRSIYGSAICVPYGRTRLAPQLIWAGNFKATPASGKSAKGKKGNQTTYSMDADLLLGFGPVQTVGGLWIDNEFHPGQVSSQTFSGAGPATTFNFTVTNNTQPFWNVIGVVLQQTFSVSYNDYGGQPVTLSGTTELPLYNQGFPAPNSGDWQHAPGPYAVYNASFASPNVTVVFPTPVSGITVIVYYKESQNTDTAPTSAPLTFKNLEFEAQLGSGGEGAPQVYSDFSGVGAPNLDLGAVNVMPGYSFEVVGLYSYGKTGDANPADIVADIICSGNQLLGWGGSFPPPVWQHGLNLTSLVAPDAAGGVPSTGPYNPAYSRYGGILDDEPNLWGPAYSGGTNLGLNLFRAFCQAYGIFLSRPIDSQQNAAQYLDDLLAITGTAGCWDGAQLKLIPYCEVSNYGNGASYVAPTAAGPVATFTDDDYIQKDAKGNPKPPVEVTRQRASDNYNSMTVSFTDRMSSATAPHEGHYDSSTVTVTDQADVTVQGSMPGTTLDYAWIPDKDIAAKVAWMIMRRNLLVERRTYKWSASARFGLLSLMELVTLMEPNFPGGKADVRITKITENPDWSLDFEGEPFIYGACVPVIPDVTPASGGGELPGNQGADPGTVNPPIIFETIPAMGIKPQLGLCLSGSDPNYGGCTVWLSTDGGSTYQAVGKAAKNTMGEVYSSNFPSHTDPDTANTLHVDLTESLGTLASFTDAQRDIFQSLCYLAGGGTVTGTPIVVSNIQRLSTWRFIHDSGTPGTSSGASALVATPSLSGQARQDDITWSGFGGERYSTPLGVANLDTLSDTFSYDVWIYVTDLSNINNLEFDLNQVLANGDTVIFGMQFNYALGFVEYTSNLSGSTHWNTSSVPCSRFSNNSWHHLVFKYHRDSVGNVTYDSVSVDGAVSTLGVTVNSAFSLGWSPLGDIVLNFQMDGNSGSHSTTAYLDLLTITRSIGAGGGGTTVTIPYELVAYATATLAAANKYSLPPTLRRGVYGTPIVAHNIGSDFSFLDDGNVFMLDLKPEWIGVTLNFKFTAFNVFGGNEQDLASVSAVPFTPTGLVGWSFTDNTVPTGGQPVPTGGGGGTAANDQYLYIPPIAGTYGASQELYFSTPVRNITFPANLTGSNAGCRVAPTGAVSILIQKNGTTVGSIDIAAGATVATFTFSTAVTLNGVTDTFSLVAPSSPDGTLSGFWVDFQATRAN